MENLVDISEPQILPHEQKDQLVQFSICLFDHVSMGEIAFLPLKLD